MMWVARAGRAAGRSLRPARPIWIGRTDPCAIGLAARRRRLRFVSLALLRAIRGADPRADRGIRFHDTVVRATGRDQTAVELHRGAIDQPGPDALPHGAHEQLRKHLAAPPRPRLREHAVIGRLVIEAGAQEPPPIQPLGAGAAPARIRRGRSPGKAETGVSTAPRIDRAIAAITVVGRDRRAREPEVDRRLHSSPPVVGPPAPVKLRPVAEPRPWSFVLARHLARARSLCRHGFSTTPWFGQQALPAYPFRLFPNHDHTF